MSTFSAVLASLPRFQAVRTTSGTEHHVETSGLQVSTHFAVTAHLDEIDRDIEATWALTHLPSGRAAAWAKDGELLIWLAARLEEIAGEQLASPRPWELSRWPAVSVEVLRFGARRLD